MSASSDADGALDEEDWVARLARHGPDREALCLGSSVSVDHATLAEAVSAMGERLRALGIEPGDRVAVLAPPSVEGVVLIHALLAFRIVLLPLNARLQAGELDEILASSAARWLIASETGPATQGLAERAGCGLLRLAASPPRSRIDIDGGARHRSHGAGGIGIGFEVDVDRLPRESGAAEKEGTTLAAQRASLREQGAALVLYTSGTSGRPKGAVLTRASLLASARAQAQLLGVSAPPDRWLLCMPLFHVGGLSILIRSALAGTAVVLHERFDAERVSEALDRDGITHVSFVATMLSRLLAVRGSRRAPASLRLVLLGGGPAPSALLERARALGYPLAPTYGLTEAASQVATRPPDAPDALDASASSGTERAVSSPGLRPLPGIEVRIVDAAGRPLAPDEVGEIEVRGPIVMAGYLDDPEASARVLRNGWLATGDLGRLDAAGDLHVLDRRADLIVSGGENVYPAEIESVLASHPEIEEAGVVGIEDELFGQRPFAFVVWRGRSRLDAAALDRWCRERLAGFKRPVGFEAVGSLPRTASGKLIRRALQALVDQAMAPNPGPH